MVQQGLRRTGYDEVALTSLSTADFSGIEDVVTTAMDDSVGCGNVSVSLPSLRVDAFTVGVAAQIQKARRTGLTFAPEAGTWRMRQVINKLITEEDLHSAGRLGLQPGLAPGEALLPHRAPHRDRRGHARHHRAGPPLRGAGQGQRPQRHRHRERRRLRAQGVHPVPVVRHEHRGRAASQGEPAPRRRPPRQGRADQVARPQGEPRRGAGEPRRPAARTCHRARLARRRHLPGVERALPARPLGGRDGGRRARHGLVLPPPPHRGRDAAVGPPVGGAPQGLPLAGLAGRPRGARPRGLPLDPLLRLRCLHRLRHRARGRLGRPARRRQPGHRPGPPARRRGARHAVARKPVEVGA